MSNDRRFVVKVPKKRSRTSAPGNGKVTVLDRTDDFGTLEDRLLDELEVDLQDIDETISPPPNPYMDDPKGWINNRLGEFIWSKQEEICLSVRDFRYTAVKSCHQIGKSFIAAAIICWWLDTHPDAFVVTTAPTSHQVRSVLWRYIKRCHKKAKMAGKITEGQVPEWKIGNELVGFGRKPADYTDSSDATTNFQGTHALHILVVMDEASGIPAWLVNAIDTLVGNPKSRVLAIGNPDNPTSEFAKMFRPGSDYNRISVPYYETPAFTDEEVPDYLYDLLISEIWVEERRKKWGESSSLFKSKVLAEFPDISDDAVFSPADIATAIAVDRSSHATTAGTGYAGLDIGRLGPDECCLYTNYNGYVRLALRWGKTDTMESVGRFRRYWQGRTPASTVVDASGVGGGVFDRLRELSYPVSPFDGGSRANDPMRFKNRRAEAYWEAKEMCENGLVDIEELDEDLQAELLEVKYKVNSTGQVVLEEKDDIKERLGHSPNRADAFVMALQRKGSWMKSIPVPEAPGYEPESNPELHIDNNYDEVSLDGIMEVQF